MSEIDVCGVLVRTRSEKAKQVQDRLERIPGVEIHAATDDGRLVVTVEGAPGRNVLDSVTGLLDVPGVIATSLVYQHTDSDETEQESAT